MEDRVTEKLSLAEYVAGLPDNTKLKLMFTERQQLKAHVEQGGELLRKYFASEKAESLANGDILHYVTREEVDRDGDVVLVDGIDTSNFRGTVFFNHDTNVPLGKAIWTKQDPASVVPAILAKTRFVGGDEFSDRIKKLYTEDIEGTGPVLQTWSMSFIPVKMRVATTEDKAKYGDRCRKVYEQVEMIEYSAVGVPSNRAAVTIAVGKHFDAETADFVRSLCGEEETSMDEEQTDKAASGAVTVADAPAESKAMTLDGRLSIHGIKNIIERRLAILFPYSTGVEYVYVDDMFPDGPTTGVCVAEVCYARTGDQYVMMSYDVRGDTVILSDPQPVVEAYVPKALFADTLTKSGQRALAANQRVMDALRKSNDEMASVLAEATPLTATLVANETILKLAPSPVKEKLAAEDAAQFIATAMKGVAESIVQQMDEHVAALQRRTDEQLNRAMGRVKH